MDADPEDAADDGHGHDDDDDDDDEMLLMVMLMMMTMVMTKMMMTMVMTMMMMVMMIVVRRSNNTLAVRSADGWDVGDDDITSVTFTGVVAAGPTTAAHIMATPKAESKRHRHRQKKRPSTALPFRQLRRNLVLPRAPASERAVQVATRPTSAGRLFEVEFVGWQWPNRTATCSSVN